MGLFDEVRRSCAEIAARARWVAIDTDRLAELETAEPPALEPEAHYLEGPPEAVAAYMLTLDSINFGSGWFPTLRKRPGRSGYFTVAGALTAHWREHGPWAARELRLLDAPTVARVLGQDPGHELMGLYAEALRDLGRFLGERGALEVIADSGGSAERLATALARGIPFFDDVGFFKRAQIAAHDLQLAGVASFADLDRSTIFADNLVPHVLRVDGVLRYSPELSEPIDAGRLLPQGPEEREIRGCAVHACELLAQRLDVAPRVLDGWLWNRGQEPRYKARPRHRTRCVWY